MSAINRAQVFRFLTKPWDAPDILAAVEQACDYVAQRRAILRLVEIVASRNDELAAMLQELKATQQQVLHLDRLGTIGRLTSGVTHDLRNFLTGLALLEEDIETREVPADLRETVGIGLAGVRNLVSTLESMGQFASSGRLGVERAPMSPAVVVRDATTVLRMDMEFRRRNVVASVEEGLPDIVADRQKLVQVLVNLIRNAVQATAKGQGVTIQVASAPGGGVVFAVEDEGPGVPPEVREKLFNPFVSSKGSGGMGMGLYMARLVAESHGGWIACVDRPGGGTRFEVVIGTGRAD
jgi:signal transduction histidine kinase